MAGIYIHIPFCKQKCNYCNFYSLASVKNREELVSSLIHEIKLQKDYLVTEPVATIYLGGGTPSLLKTKDIHEILSTVIATFVVEKGAEITLEANPEDLDRNKLKEFKKAGINRLSIGIQSFEDKDLQFLNRIHTGKQAFDSVQLARDAGFHNLSIDLIYGIPTLDSVGWESNLVKAIDLGVPHISAYALTVEEKTPLSVMIRRGKIPDVDDTLQLQHFNILTRLLESGGYHHYEISNFCIPDRFSRHNTSYWNGVPYLGIGPSAHSFNGFSRQWNVAHLGKYIESIRQDKVPFEQEILTSAQQYNEYVMTSLRTMWGCNLNEIRNRFGEDWAEKALTDADRYILAGHMILKEDILYLTKRGMFIADGIATHLFRLDS